MGTRDAGIGMGLGATKVSSGIGGLGRRPVFHLNTPIEMVLKVSNDEAFGKRFSGKIGNANLR